MSYKLESSFEERRTEGDHHDYPSKVIKLIYLPIDYSLSTMQAKTSNMRKAKEQEVVIRGADGKAYRRTVQVFFVNEKGEFLICRPVGVSNTAFCQTVQGGSLRDETPIETAVRESWEEIGLDITQNASYLTEVWPRCTSQGPVLEDSIPLAKCDTELKNERGELISDDRAAFRYTSKKWRKQGLAGQEIYPLLLFLPSQAIQSIQVKSRSRGVRQEFVGVYWGSLAEIEHCAPPVKQEVMSSVCPAVAATVLPFLMANGYPLQGVSAYIANTVA